MVEKEHFAGALYRGIVMGVLTDVDENRGLAF